MENNMSSKYALTSNVHYNDKYVITLQAHLKPQSHQFTTEKCWNRGKIVERTYDWSHISWVITRAKSVVSSLMVMFKTPKAPVTPGLRPGYDLRACEKCWHRRQIVEWPYNWLQMSWVIMGAQSVVAMSMLMFKTSNLRFQIVWCHDWSSDRS